MYLWTQREMDMKAVFITLQNLMVSTRAGSVAAFSFRYPAFRDTERRNYVLAYPQSNRSTNRK